MTVQTYNLTRNGKHVRQATSVILDDGRVIAFLDKIPAKMALKQVQQMTKRQLEAAIVR